MEFRAIINGKKVLNDNWLEIINPSDQKVAGRVTALSEKEISEAFEVARNSQLKWSQTKLLDRIMVLKKFRDLIENNSLKIAQIMSLEIAKGLKDSQIEVQRTLELIDYTFEEAKRLNPLALTGEEFGVENKLGVFSRVPKGVVLAISPFNYPVNLSLAKIFPALVTGNTVVFKPATAGSLVGAFLGELSLEANLPPGIFNVVTGRGREIGDLITANPQINFISFTGSVGVGEHLKSISQTKDFVLELGGKDPALVLDDQNLEINAKEIVAGAFGYSGQRCTAIKRVLTTDEIADKLVPLLLKEVKKLKVGYPNDNPDIVPMIDEKSAEFVQTLVDDAKEKKAKIIFGGNRKKNMFEPTLVDYVTKDMKLAWEEPFGPVLPILRLKSVGEMIEIANESNFGLQASIFSRDINQAIKIAKALNCGTVNINGKSQRGPDSFPFSGIKDSGMGVQGVREALLSMTRFKGIVINYK
ncbi:glyceraldehyde-3-phosphate dehydrogenase [Spiroplasma sabaudiense Ar-1343]|uniref:Glyceraldehyde-3-phosphate dehydrogenase n=1 Tax=Spiroplasma sabaudiense Ar-1343 TaxID=1276257 RepID=W6AAD5_9MOLU|nr:NADP-dependent glyceraldehyde-3-phosphate dehydrogenase [Spiroplasma sabaudiense]AHI54022.1 glyceraldehyde-3-phosphate dehydrogenase [Spiroplasma sabaudiense Ar-1343]